MNKVVKVTKSASPEEEASTSQPHGIVAMFVAKLWAIVNMPETNNLICWSASGQSFIIKDSARFAKELLPHYYKHNHMASFVRQLNMYGFHKKASVEQGGLKCDKDEMEFAHPHFCKGYNILLPQIKRKIAHNKNQNQDTKESNTPDLVSSVLTDVKTMRARQDEFEKLLNTVKHENTTLWRELMILSQKNMQQHKLINKLIHFLVTLVQSRRSGLTVKRRLYPLMIDNSSPPRKKNKLAEPQTSPTGPVIHELDASEPGLASEYIVSDMLESEDPAVQSPGSTDSYAKLEVPVDDDSEESIHLMTHPGYSEASEIKIPSPPDPDEMETSGQFEADEIEISDTLEADEIEMLDSSEAHAIQEVLDKETRWKTKVPVKILIPPLENGEKPREELHLLEMPVSEGTPMNVTILNNETIGSKSVPVATVRSSKLMAMAASMKSCQQNIDQETDTETLMDDVDDDTSDNDTSNSNNFGDALIVPNVCNNNKTRNNTGNRINVDRKPNKVNEDFNHIYNGKSVLKGISNRNKENAAIKSSREENDSCNVASTSKDLSLSCVNSSGVTEANYRDTLCSYLETMENNLEGFRERLNSDGYSIDANTILELLNSDDAISLALPDLPPDLPSELLLNSELNSEENCKKEKENHFQSSESLSGLNRGELMTYNSSNNHYLDDIFFSGNPSSSLSMPEMTNVTADLMFDPDSLNEENDKTPLFNLDNFQNNDTDSRL